VAEPSLDPYAPPRADTSLGEEGGEGAMTMSEIHDFVVVNAPYFQFKWLKANKTGGFYGGFNLTACIFSGSWLAYRKMFFWVGTYLAASLSLMFLTGGLVAAFLPGVPAALHLVWLAALVPHVAIGFFGNGLYLRRARAVVASVRAIEPDPERRRLMFAKRGGVSALAVVILWIVSMAIRVAVS
jgi:hypothetical protein